MHPKGNVHIVYDPKLRVALTSSSIKTLPEEEKWDKEAIEGILATPWDWRAGVSDTERMPHMKVRTDPMSTETKTNTVPIRMMGEDHRQGTKKKQFYVTKPMILNFGTTTGCPACQRLGQKQKIQQGHNRKCHDRIFDKIVEKYGRHHAKKMRIKSADWEARIRLLEQQEKTGSSSTKWF